MLSVRKPKRTSAVTIPIVTALACLPGCGGGAAAGVAESSTSDADPIPGAEEIPRAEQIPTELRALGYGGWDEADTREVAPPDGVVSWAPERAASVDRVWADDRSTIHVMSPSGRSHRTITVPGHTQVEFARPLEGGRLLALSVDEGVTLMEPDGAVIWQISAPCHHEITVAPRPGDEPGERLFAVALHHTRDFRGRRVRFDEVAFLEEATGLFTGDPAWPTWSTWEHREALERAVGGEPHPLSRPQARTGEASGKAEPTYDYFHLNGIDFAPDAEAPVSGHPGELDGGQTGATMVVCLRNVSLVAGVRVPGGEVEWSIGPGILDWPHAPSLTVGADGSLRLMAFDNGTHRGWSRVVELDLGSRVVVWEWRGPAGRPLWSRVRGFAERLRRGHVLVTESERGRSYEITPAGEVVWEFLNPDMRETETGAQRRRIYRMTGLRDSR